MLVHREAAERRRIEHVAGKAHRLRQCSKFRGVQAAQENGHQQRGNLRVRGCLGGRLAGDQRADEALDLGVSEDAAVALVLNYVNRMKGHLHTGFGSVRLYEFAREKLPTK